MPQRWQASDDGELSKLYRLMTPWPPQVLRLRAAVAIYHFTRNPSCNLPVAGDLASDPEKWLREKARACLAIE